MQTYKKVEEKLHALISVLNENNRWDSRSSDFPRPKERTPALKREEGEWAALGRMKH
jgi:hypothetical protein